MNINSTTRTALTPLFSDSAALESFVKSYGKNGSCHRCGGAGYGSWYQDGGICYSCRGAKTDVWSFADCTLRAIIKKGVDAWTAQTEAKAAVKKAKAEAKYAAECEARRIETERLAAEQAILEAAKNEVKADMYESTNWLSEVGMKVQAIGIVRKITSGFKQYSSYGDGMWRLTVIELQDGSSVKYWNHFSPLSDAHDVNYAEEGDLITFKGTVKEHTKDDWTGAKCTIIQRAKLVKITRTEEVEAE